MHDVLSSNHVPYITYSFPSLAKRSTIDLNHVGLVCCKELQLTYWGATELVVQMDMAVLFMFMQFSFLLTKAIIFTSLNVFLADRTIGRAIGTACRLSSVVCRLSVVCLWRFVLWQNGAS